MAIQLPAITIPDNLVLTANDDSKCSEMWPNVWPANAGIFHFTQQPPEDLNIKYCQDRYKIIGEVKPEVIEPCPDICPLGQYWDCNTMSCKNYSSYTYVIKSTRAIIDRVSHEVKFPYHGSGIVQQSVGGGKYGYVFETVDAESSKSGKYIPYVFRVPYTVPKLENMIHKQDPTYSSDERDYFEYGIVSGLPSYLIGQSMTEGMGDSLLGTFKYSQTWQIFSTAGVSLYPGASDNGNLEPWMEAALSGTDEVWIGRNTLIWTIDVYGVKS